jgi:hypothetical protein
LSGGTEWQSFAGHFALTILGDCVSEFFVHVKITAHHLSFLAFFLPTARPFDSADPQLPPPHCRPGATDIPAGRHRLEGTVYDLAKAKKLLDVRL